MDAIAINLNETNVDIYELKTNTSRIDENQNTIQDMIEKHSEKVSQIVVAIDELGINQLETKDIANDHSETLSKVELKINAVEQSQLFLRPLFLEQSKTQVIMENKIEQTEEDYANVNTQLSQLISGQIMLKEIYKQFKITFAKLEENQNKNTATIRKYIINDTELVDEVLEPF